MTVAAEYRTSPGVPSRLAPIRLHGLPISDFPNLVRGEGGIGAVPASPRAPPALSDVAAHHDGNDVCRARTCGPQATAHVATRRIATDGIDIFLATWTTTSCVRMTDSCRFGK